MTTPAATEGLAPRATAIDPDDAADLAQIARHQTEAMRLFRAWLDTGADQVPRRVPWDEERRKAAALWRRIKARKDARKTTILIEKPTPCPVPRDESSAG